MHFFLYPRHRPNITACLHYKINKLQHLFTILLLNICQQEICLQIPIVWHMAELSIVYLWQTSVNRHTIYEVAPINDLARITLYRWWWQWHRKMMMMMHNEATAGCIYWVRHLDKSVKNEAPWCLANSEILNNFFLQILWYPWKHGHQPLRRSSGLFPWEAALVKHC